MLGLESFYLDGALAGFVAFCVAGDMEYGVGEFSGDGEVVGVVVRFMSACALVFVLVDELGAIVEGDGGDGEG